MKKKVLLKLLIFLVASVPMMTFAQLDNEPQNIPKYDHDRIHFGFCLGVNSSSFVINRVGDFKIRDTIWSVDAEPSSGLNLGIVSNVRISEYFDFRFIPTLSFGQRTLNYSFIYNDTTKANTPKQIESTYLEFPFLIKYKSRRVNNYRVYVTAGMKYAIDMISQAKVKNTDKDVIKLKRNDYGYEIGVGFDFYLTYFKFSPELKMYNGLTNLLLPENTPYSSPIDALYAKTFVISFLFE